MFEPFILFLILLTPTLTVVFYFTLFKGRKYPPGLPPDYEILKNDLGEYRFRVGGRRCGPFIRKSAEAALRDAWDEHFRFQIDKKRTFYPIESDK